MTEPPTHEDITAKAVASLLIETFYSILGMHHFVGLGSHPTEDDTGDSPVAQYSFIVNDPRKEYRWKVVVRCERVEEEASGHPSAG